MAASKMTDPPAASLPRTGIRGLFHCGMVVSNIERSLTFYRDLLGLPVRMLRVYEEPYIFEQLQIAPNAVRIAFLGIPGTDAGIELLEFRAEGTAARRPETRNHVCLYVNDLDGLYRRLKEAGTTFLGPHPVTITAGPNHGATVILARDPDANLIELLERPPS